METSALPSDFEAGDFHFHSKIVSKIYYKGLHNFSITLKFLTNESNLSELRTIANLSQPRPVCKSGVGKG